MHTRARFVDAARVRFRFRILSLWGGWVPQ
jgi:hypothetical protein